ncbi:MAG TPA: hypothetical protein VH969_21430 [Actinophytocola sp.]|uniref:alginate O-acetyltransferase AlgX-related protein n=1 Tax=Actinophytocola sp. TaxID=1872138 RepID=UPI002F940497
MTLHDRRSVGGLPPLHEAWLPREHALHRPRHGGRQLTALICALVFFTTPAFMWLFGMRPVALENHQVKGFPSILEGWGFLTGMDPWATENLVFRPEAIAAADWVSRTLFGEAAPYDQGNGAPAGPLPGGPPKPETGTTTPDDPSATDQDSAGYRRVIEGSDGWMYLGLDTANKCKPKQPLDKTIKQLDALRDAVEASGRKFMLVAVPDKSTMVPEHLPDSYPGKHCASEVTPGLWRNLATAGAIDMRPSLQATSELLGRPVYFPLDSHWTDEGALTMVRQLADRIEPGVSENWRIERSETHEASADLPPLIGKQGENKAPSFRLLPDGETDRTGTHLKDPRKPIRRSSEPIDGMVDKSTLLLGDSFMLPASAYLSGAFSDITQLYYNTIESDPALVASTMVENDVVVFEIVERNIALGTPEILDGPFIDHVREELQKHPIR